MYGRLLATKTNRRAESFVDIPAIVNPHINRRVVLMTEHLAPLGDGQNGLPQDDTALVVLLVNPLENVLGNLLLQLLRPFNLRIVAKG